MAVRLVVIEGYDKDKFLMLDSACSYSIGRGDTDRHVDLKLDPRDRLVSRRHFIIDYRPPRIFIRDNNSTNGTMINGKNGSFILRNHEAELSAGDLIMAGNTVFRLEMAEDKSDDQIPSVTGLDVPENPKDFCTDANDSPSGNNSPAICCIDCGHSLTAGMTGTELESLGWPAFMCSDCADGYSFENDLKSLNGYRILKKIGEGSMGVVFLARHEISGMLAAVKTIIPGMSASKTDLILFEREANIMRTLDHPNITRLYEFSLFDGGHYFISEYMPGGDLDSLLKNSGNGRMEPDKACTIVCDVLSALDYSHEKGIIHRDIKPANILLKKDSHRNDIPKLADFGLAKMYENAGLTNITKTTDRRGTPLFMAPEQFINYRYVKPQADIYSIGVVLYSLLSGSFPFTESPERRDDPLSFLRRRDPVLAILENKPVPVIEKNPSIPVRLSEIVDTAIRKTPEQRFQSAKEMRRAILDFLHPRK